MIILQDTSIQVSEPKLVACILQDWLITLDDTDRLKEHFFVALLDARMRVKLVDVVSIGTLNASLVHPREVFIRAVSAAASSFLIAHNHPSGTLEPSDADIAITERLRKAGTLLGIELVDHLILSTKGFYSLREHGLL